METVTEFLNKLAGTGLRLSVEGGRADYCYAQKGVLTTDTQGRYCQIQVRNYRFIRGAGERATGTEG